MTDLGPDDLRGKRESLDRILREMGSVVVAFSGGVDSSFLAVRAHLVLGDRALSVTAESESLAEDQRQMVLRIARQFGLRHRMVRAEELAAPGYRRNAPDRCYHCKAEQARIFTALARAEGYAYVADGTMADDLTDYRPGRRAAQEAGLRSPLLEADLGKADIRALSRADGLPNWDAPSSPCLASRIPYGTGVTAEALRRIDRAEAAVRALGFRELRIRHLGNVARVEIAPDEIGRIEREQLASRIRSAVQTAGYQEVIIDPNGYRRGRLNEDLAPAPA